MYEWRHDITHWIDGLLLGGNYHASELSFVFANQWPPILHDFTSADREMSDFIVSRWSALAASLRGPNPPGTNASGYWPRWSEQLEEHLRLQLPVETSTHLRADICDSLWDTLPL